MNSSTPQTHTPKDPIVVDYLDTSEHEARELSMKDVKAIIAGRKESDFRYMQGWIVKRGDPQVTLITVTAPVVAHPGLL